MRSLETITMQERLIEAVDIARTSLRNLLISLEGSGKMVKDEWREHLIKLDEEFDYLSTADSISIDYLHTLNARRDEDDRVVDDILAVYPKSRT